MSTFIHCVAGACVAIGASGCGNSVEQDQVVVVDTRSQALSALDVLSINGDYSGCHGRTGSWSVALDSGAVLDHTALSVILNDVGCVLSLTELHTAVAGLDAISPPLVLGLSFAPTASAIPDSTDVNARLDRVDFAADFVITVVFSDDPAFGDPADNTAIAIPPEVIAHTPTAATDVPITVRPTVTFDATMDPATLTPLTFTLQLGGVPVGASVAYDVGSHTATLTPDLYLEVDTDYVVTVTTGVHDTGDTPLAADVSFTFRTSLCGQAPIELGTAESFAVLAASTITNTGGTTVTGNLGLSPGTSVVGFPPGIVNGEIHITDAAAAAAQADMAVAFNEAVGRSV